MAESAQVLKYRYYYIINTNLERQNQALFGADLLSLKNKT
jgi:hypothetical protein